jgi:hypothetical protein
MRLDITIEKLLSSIWIESQYDLPFPKIAINLSPREIQEWIEFLCMKKRVNSDLLRNHTKSYALIAHFPVLVLKHCSDNRTLTYIDRCSSLVNISMSIVLTIETCSIADPSRTFVFGGAEILIGAHSKGTNFPRFLHETQRKSGEK